VGKSTLISRISAAKPKIADYPFTTLEPHLGVVRTDDETTYTVADIPGLVEGAAEGKGLGHQFLRHITRARALVVLVELDPVTGVSPEEQHRVLIDELGRYQPDLLDRPRLVVGSKADMVSPDDLPATVAPESFDRDAVPSGDEGFRPDLVISSVTGQGIPALIGRLATLVDQARTAEPESDGTIVIHRPLPEGFSVERVGEGEYAVIGKVAERAVALNDTTTDEAADYLQGRLKRLGVDRALAKAGARDGDLIHIGDVSFTWFRDQPEFTGEPSSRRKRRR
jgi:GTP-binding protein